MPPKSKKSLLEKSPKNKTKRCPKGEQRNPKTGLCEKKGDKGERQKQQKEIKQKPEKQIVMREKPKNLSKMTIKDKAIYEKRKECIDAYRKKLPSLLQES